MALELPGMETMVYGSRIHLIAHPGRKLAAFVVSKSFRRIVNFPASGLRQGA